MRWVGRSNWLVSQLKLVFPFFRESPLLTPVTSCASLRISRELDTPKSAVAVQGAIMIWALSGAVGFVPPARVPALLQSPPLSPLSGAISRPLWTMSAEPKLESRLREGEERGPDGVVCARGVCAITDRETSPETCFLDEEDGQVKSETNPDASKQWWPSALLLGCSVLYGTNFPLGRLMNDALPASATSSARFLLAAIALSPFLLKINPAIRLQARRCWLGLGSAAG